MLAEVQDLLVALPDDAFAERKRLRKRQEELLEQAARHAAGVDVERPTDDLLAEIDLLRLRYQDAEGTDESLRIATRISHLEAVLRSRNVSVSPPD